MKKNFIKIFLLIFLISNLIFSENKKLRELMQRLLKYLKMMNMQKIRKIFIMEAKFLMKQILKVLNHYQKLVLDWEKIKIIFIFLSIR